jgi:hypothetical protein
MHGMTYVFVGERPSARAERIGATWKNGRLAGKTLREALEAAGLDPDAQYYINLWPNAAPQVTDCAHEALVVELLRHHLAAGHQVVGMGCLVCRTLSQHGIPHHRLIHPAARGAIRARSVYQAHVRAVLMQGDYAATELQSTGSSRGLERKKLR